MTSVNLDGQNFNFNLGLLVSKNVGIGGNENKPSEYTRLDVGPISTLHIEEDLVNMGIRGHFCVKNQAQFLERIEAIRSTETTVYLDVTIEDTDTATDRVEDRFISFLAILETSTGVTSDLINNNIIFTFEEAYTSLLKKTSMKNLFPLWNKDVDGDLKVGAYLKIILQAWTKSLLTPDTKLGDIIKFDQFKWESGEVGNINAFWWDVEDSVYDVLYRIAESIQLVNNRGARVPVLKLNNVKDPKNDKGIMRRFTFQEIFTDRHHEFLRAQKEQRGGSFADVYLEEFTIAPHEIKSGLPAFNTVERYDMLKADVGKARDAMWGDYMMNDSNSDITVINIQLLEFEKIVDAFERNDLISTETSWYSAIPVIAPQERKIHLADRLEQKDPGEFTSVISQYVQNRVKRSFLFLNDSIVFSTRGQIYRRPGAFITINGGDILGGEPNNIWLVTSVSHKFSELDYSTEIVAVRLFGNSDYYKNLVADDRVRNSSAAAGGGSLAAGVREIVNTVNQAVGAPSNLTPVGDVNQTGVVDRSRINEELKNDPDLQRLLYASAKAEVGSQGDAAIQGYMESVMNRSLATGRTLRSTLTDKGYYPASTKSKLNISNPPDYSTQMNKVLAGSNITNYATDNASNQRGNPLAQRRLAAGNPGTTIGGELFYTNIHGSKLGSYDGVPKHRVWRDGQLKNAPPTTGTS